MKPLVTVVTPTTGNQLCKIAIDAVARQTYSPIQHLVVIDGAEWTDAARAIIGSSAVDVVELPYATGRNRFNGHRIYGASAYLARGDLIAFLDEDNWPDPDHVESLVETIGRGYDWAYSLRKVALPDGTFLCEDNCESLGKWPSVLGDDDYFIDVSSFLLPRMLAVAASPIWYRKTSEPGVQEVDRALTRFLRERAPNFECNFRYSMNYRTGSTALSVRPEFFIRGNATVAKRYGGKLPWKHQPE